MQTESSAREPAAVELALEGDIDVTTAGPLGDQLCELVDASPRRIAVVCASVTFIESRGLAMMARVQRYAEESGCRLTWREPPVARVADHPRQRARHLPDDRGLTIEA